MALYDTLPKLYSWSFITWNKQLPSLGAGSWRYASPAFSTSNSLVIHCSRKPFYKYVQNFNSVFSKSIAFEEQMASVEYFSLLE